VRLYQPSDLEDLRRMHEQQHFEYSFPDLEDPLFVAKLVMEDDRGSLVMVALARVTCEMYLLMDSTAGTPIDRYERLASMNDIGAHELRARGFEDAHAWLPPRIAKRFGRRLGGLGWVRDDAWTPYCRRLR
jgi:hypothetical protein